MHAVILVIRAVVLSGSSTPDETMQVSSSQPSRSGAALACADLDALLDVRSSSTPRVAVGIGSRSVGKCLHHRVDWYVHSLDPEHADGFRDCCSIAPRHDILGLSVERNRWPYQERLVRSSIESID